MTGQQWLVGALTRHLDDLSRSSILETEKITRRFISLEFKDFKGSEKGLIYSNHRLITEL